MPAAAVVYVHGLWMVGAEAAMLQRHLWRDRGYRLHVFRYGSVKQPLPEIVATLSETIARIDAPEVHLLGHSLGGSVILHCLERYPMAQPGRVVFMGAPVLGSCTAQALERWRLGSWPLGRWLLGHTATHMLLEPRARRWAIARELGIIAGTLPLGFGQLLRRFGPENNDGTVAVSETQLPGAKAYLELRVSHTGLLWSARAARAAGNFLEYGCFSV